MILKRKHGVLISQTPFLPLTLTGTSNMTFDDFLKRVRDDLNEFEVMTKATATDLGSDGSFTEVDWYDYFFDVISRKFDL